MADWALPVGRALLYDRVGQVSGGIERQTKGASHMYQMNVSTGGAGDTSSSGVQSLQDSSVQDSQSLHGKGCQFRDQAFFFSSRRRHTRLTCDWSSRVLFRSVSTKCHGPW